MNFAGFLCYNCQGKGHRSSKCPFPPAHRRCPSCGIAGGDYMHREGCREQWYDLSIRVPRYKQDGQTKLTKQEVENHLKESYETERLRHQTRSSVIEHRLDTRLAAFIPIVHAENWTENADCREKFLSLAHAENRSENADIRDERSRKTLLLRLVFAKTPTVYIDFGNGRDIELRETLFQMQNGLDVKYASGMLDFYGLARESATFMVTMVQGAFRIKIERDVVEINGSHVFTEIGLTIRANCTAPAGADPTKYGITTIGGSEQEIGIRYKAKRFIMKLHEDIIQINPFEPTRRLN